MKGPILMIATLLLVSACGNSGKVEEESATAKPPQTTHGEAAEVIALTPEQIKHSEIGLATAGTATVRETLSLYGTIAPNAERVREVAARYAGVIRNVNKRIGDPVKAGETLATVESNESLQQYSVTAPLDGVVTSRSVNPGEQTGDKPLFTVADLSTVWVEIALFPRDVGKVKVGQGVRIRSADTGQTATGQISYRASFGSSTSQTLTARVLLDNRDRLWAPGLYVTADVVLSETTVPVTVRNEALQVIEDKNVVFVKTARGFEPRSVRLGRKDREASEILGGISNGDMYVTTNSFILAAELGKDAAGHED